MEYMCENGVLTGDAAVDPYGWVEDRREVLELRKKERASTRHGNDGMVMLKLVSMVDLLTEAVLLLKLVLGLLAIVSLLLISKK